MPWFKRRKPLKKQAKKIFWAYSLELDRESALLLRDTIRDALLYYPGRLELEDEEPEYVARVHQLDEIYQALSAVPKQEEVRYPHARPRRRTQRAHRNQSR